MPKNSEIDLEKVRHSLSHLLAMAVLELFPEAKLAIGPTIENGFYYDFSLPRTLIPEDLPILEEKMRALIKKKLKFSQSSQKIDEALLWAEEKEAPFKRELIADLQAAGENEVTFYTTGDDQFTDLCKGPHVDNTDEIPADAFALTHISGAYWKGDENREQLQRIYGVAFAAEKELTEYQKRLEEAVKRDHRKLGREMDLFTFSPLVGSGLPLFTPKGQVLREELERLLRSLQDPAGFQRVNIPHIAKSDLYKTSGHWDKFAEDLFHVSGHADEEMVMKPMNCPHHTQIYASRPRSWRDLPIRYAEVTTCYRDEQPGELLGLSRVRSLTQDDGHVFCRADQVEGEVEKIMQIISAVYKVFAMPLAARLSLRDPENKKAYLGGDRLWDEAEALLAKLAKKLWPAGYTAVRGEAAFYGPKIDFMAEDSIGRHWQLATVQLDFNMPERFNLEYTDEKGKKERPVMIHRAILGSLERFLSVIIEHYAGKFPLWLSPEQVRIVTISDGQQEYADRVLADLLTAGLRATIDQSNETMGKKIRQAEIDKIPVVFVLGDREVKEKTVTPRLRQDLSTKQISALPIAEAISALVKDYTQRSAKLSF